MNELKLPVEWIDRIFKRLAEAYGERFASKFLNPAYVEMERSRWQSGLYGVTSDEIRRVLDMCRSGFITQPPTVIDFYHYCKGFKQPPSIKKVPPRNENDQVIGEQYLKLILDKLHGRLDSDGEIALSTLDKQILGKHDGKTKEHWQDT
ncbi:MAG TPA: hypothetical protein VJ279_08525 [Hanamia sp.]|jgi:hypothetical protein|nr:hypothetical protein [Hanamia sp.]